jgi:hypothetical protein
MTVTAIVAGHGVFDALHGYLVVNPGVPALVAGLLSGGRRHRGGSDGLVVQTSAAVDTTASRRHDARWDTAASIDGWTWPVAGSSTWSPMVGGLP